MNIWHFGLISLGLPFFLLLLSEIDFSVIVFIAFTDGWAFFTFANSVTEYIDSRKVYWRKMK